MSANNPKRTFAYRPAELSRVANGFDIVTVRIKYECCIVVRMVMRAKTRRSVFSSVGRYTGSEESIDISPRSCIESEVGARFHRSVFR